MSFISINKRDIFISRNTAYFYLNGIQKYAYDKRSDFQEDIGDGYNVYLPGEKAPIVDIEGTVFGIEICLDH
jgi:predicted amidohydrolase